VFRVCKAPKVQLAHKALQENKVLRDPKVRQVLKVQLAHKVLRVLKVIQAQQVPKVRPERRVQQVQLALVA
jgi:hypothetical protein